VSLVLTFELLDHPDPIRILRRGIERVRATPFGGAQIAASSAYQAGPGLVAVDVDVPQDPRIYQGLLLVLLEVDLWERTFMQIPPVLSGGIRFEAEPQGVEWWRSSYAIRQRGAADCEDIATDYAAELVLAGFVAAPALELELERRPDGGRAFHVVTMASDGSGPLERLDPSAEIEAQNASLPGEAGSWL